MAVVITSAGLIAAYPEWVNAPADVLANAIDTANEILFELYEDFPAQETKRRYLEAGIELYSSPLARDMQPENSTDVNPYRAKADKMDLIKGGAYRGPGWPDLSAGVV